MLRLFRGKPASVEQQMPPECRASQKGEAEKMGGVSVMFEKLTPDLTKSSFSFLIRYC